MGTYEQALLPGWLHLTGKTVRPRTGAGARVMIGRRKRVSGESTRSFIIFV